jgi:hypothetical protein
MKGSQLFAIVGVVALLLAAFVVATGLAQSPDADSEPDVPLYQVDTADTAGAESSGSSSQPVASDTSADPAGITPELGEVQVGNSAPILADGSVAAPATGPAVVEQLPQGIDATTAIADLRVPGTALKRRASDVDYVPTGGGGCFYASAGSSYTVFNTGL